MRSALVVEAAGIQGRGEACAACRCSSSPVRRRARFQVIRSTPEPSRRPDVCGSTPMPKLDAFIKRGGTGERSVKVFAASGEPELPSGEGTSGPGLLRVLLNAPQLAERYFDRKWWRKPMWYFITFGFAYFAANTISLSFGAKAVNDVVASVLVVIFYEAASRVVYKADRRTVWHWLLHYFKIGTVVGFLLDSYKLGG